ncbi:MAG: M24 family metallopeptidase [Gemmatimonadota bacterium]|nr:M24 family metallopeptidase [Gemmatimonadota bacterium]
MLTTDSLPDVQAALAAADLDGWLLFDFQGTNPIAHGVLGLEGFISRRIFVWIPRSGVPHALGHAIEPGPWHAWPRHWQKSVYSSWVTLEGSVGDMVRGKRIAMEYSAGDAVPYLDRVPAGVIEMVRAAGATSIASSGELVTRFNASWTTADINSHVRAAGTIAAIAHAALAKAGERAHAGNPIAEHELMAWIQERFAAEGLSTDHGPNVSAGANAANPHYEPSARAPRLILEGDVLLIDLWAREAGGVYADQTWMATVGPPSARAQEIWLAVRDARDAAIALVEAAAAEGRALRGADVDDVARAVITDRGFGPYFTHRTGHSIDAVSLHGSGPHLDNLETREERLLVPGVGFSIEPGIYIPGEIGMRSEVNVYLEQGQAVVTPKVYQRDLIVV